MTWKFLSFWWSNAFDFKLWISYNYQDSIDITFNFWNEFGARNINLWVSWIKIVHILFKNCALVHYYPDNCSWSTPTTKTWFIANQSLGQKFHEIGQIWNFHQAVSNQLEFQWEVINEWSNANDSSPLKTRKKKTSLCWQGSSNGFLFGNFMGFSKF